MRNGLKSSHFLMKLVKELNILDSKNAWLGLKMTIIGMIMIQHI